LKYSNPILEYSISKEGAVLNKKQASMWDYYNDSFERDKPVVSYLKSIKVPNETKLFEWDQQQLIINEFNDSDLLLHFKPKQDIIELLSFQKN
jgi:hypothetical protein